MPWLLTGLQRCDLSWAILRCCMTAEKLQDILTALGGKRVLIVGDMMLDEYV
jgi:hypothetical protein